VNDIYAYGYFGCSAPVGHVELQVCIQEETSTVYNEGQVIGRSQPNGKYANYGGSQACTKGDPFAGAGSGKIEAKVSCEDPAKSGEYRSWVWAHVWGPGLHNVTGWGVSDVRWAGAACEPTTHGPGTE
jgi:hypothetical protein